eukprot:COSAG02_NODE_3971_length_5973_cov_5.170582_1_plen_814_part_00
MLVIFMVNLRTQNLTEDYEVNAGVKGMVKLDGVVGSFNNIETAEDYVAWWPNLRNALQRWDENARQGKLLGGGTTLDGMSAAAVLVGRPYITQRRRLGDVAAPAGRYLGNSSEGRGLPGFNASNDAGCPWPLDPISQTCYYRSTGKTWSSSWGLWGGTTCAKSCGGAPVEDQVYYLPHITGVLNGTYSWDPSNWIGPTTKELSHHFTLYLAGERRFATGTITLAWQDTGRLSRVSDFETHEPFAHETNAIGFYLEMFFFSVITWHLREELAELWDCICLTELLLPLEILATALELEMLRIQYVHERTAEVYDPRDPETSKGFLFPDPEDMRKHHAEIVVPMQSLKSDLELELTELKVSMEREPKPISRSTHNEYHDKVQQVLVKLLTLDADIRHHTRVGDAAVNLQLAVMWANKWQMHFPPNFLSQLSGLDRREGKMLERLDGKSAFCGINWIDVADAYVRWDTEDLNDNGQHRGGDAWVEGADTSHESSDPETFDQDDTPANAPRNFEAESSPSGRTGRSASDIKDSAVSPKLGKLFQGGKKDDPTLQMHRFAQVAPFVDYLQMLKSALNLHVNMMHAAHLKHWNGPRGANLSMTIQRAHQTLVKSYNETGTELQAHMKRFPQEISKGFHDPNPVKAMTIKIKIESKSRLLQNLFDDAGMLGFFFPGSHMWEVRRKFFETGKLSRSQSFWNSIRPSLESETGVVSGSSMQLYMQQELDGDGVEGKKTASNPLFSDDTSEGAAQVETSPRTVEKTSGGVWGKTSALNGDLVQPSKLEHHTDGLHDISMSSEAGTKGWQDWVPGWYSVQQFCIF